jgi:hypothetical protein
LSATVPLLFQEEIPIVFRFSVPKLALASAIAAASPFAASSQSYRLAYDFSTSGTPGVSEPIGTPIINSVGDIYGVSYTGGLNGCVSVTGACGTFFKLTAPKTLGGGVTETTIYDFVGGVTGGAPNANPIFAGGAFYGTTYGGGSSIPDTGNGTVYELVPSVSGYTYSVIYTFLGGNDGSRPTFMTTLAGTMYGITNFGGGASNVGIVYSLTPGAAGQPYTETIIHTFNGTSDGGVPQYIVAFGGDLYVSLSNNGAYQGGTMVKLAPPTSGGAWTETVLFSFGGTASTAYNPEGFGFGNDGNIYGAAELGGGGSCTFNKKPGCGAIFQLKPPTTGTTWTYTPIYTFQGGVDSGAPYAPPAFDNKGNLYVTSTGTVVSPTCYGSVLEISPSGGAFTTKILHTFAQTDGGDPAGLVAFGPKFGIFGFATFGGAGDDGVLYSIVP